MASCTHHHVQDWPALGKDQFAESYTCCTVQLKTQWGRHVLRRLVSSAWRSVSLPWSLSLYLSQEPLAPIYCWNDPGKCQQLNKCNTGWVFCIPLMPWVAYLSDHQHQVKPKGKKQPLIWVNATREDQTGSVTSHCEHRSKSTDTSNSQIYAVKPNKKRKSKKMLGSLGNFLCIKVWVECTTVDNCKPSLGKFKLYHRQWKNCKECSSFATVYIVNYNRNIQWASFHSCEVQGG